MKKFNKIVGSMSLEQLLLFKKLVTDFSLHMVENFYPTFQEQNKNSKKLFAFVYYPVSSTFTAIGFSDIGM